MSLVSRLTASSSILRLVCRPKRSARSSLRLQARAQRVAADQGAKPADTALLHTLLPTDKHLFGRSGTATLLLPPRFIQTSTARSSKKPTSPPPELPVEFFEEETELLARLTKDGATSTAALLGIDPDNSGAVAILHLTLDGMSTLDMLKCCNVSIYDMPVELVAAGISSKRIRRQADACEVNSIVASTQENLPEGAVTQAIVEKPVPGPLNGSYSVFGTGFAYGVWTGVLSSHNISISTVAARTWKNGLALNGLGKEGSRAMALALFPQAAHLLGRKKDHGRAEALLLLAWALGVRVQAETVTPVSNGKSRTLATVKATEEPVEQVEHDMAPLIVPALPS